MKKAIFVLVWAATRAFAFEPMFDARIDYDVIYGPYSVFSVDLDGDGDDDLVTANWLSDDVSILLGNGDGIFQSAVIYAVGDSPGSVFSIDFDEDGFSDLLTANSGSDNVSVLLNKTEQDPCCGQYTGDYTGNIDCSVDGKRNLTDITRLVDRVYVSKLELCCEANGNIDGDEDGKINLSDITRLIDHVYVSKEETAICD